MSLLTRTLPRRSFNRQTESVAQQPYIDMPANSAGRMYFYRLNQHLAQLPAAEQSNSANFYQAAPANYYAEFWDENAINGKQYGFPDDDDAGQSSDISVTNPQYRVVAVGW